jgi:hypothetical protein
MKRLVNQLEAGAAMEATDSEPRGMEVFANDYLA